MTTPRERARAQTMADIAELGRAHLARYGAAGLSLRAIARDLGVVSSAIYRYVPSRDDLLTLLLVDAYTDLGDTVERAHAAAEAADLRGRWYAIARAVRTWAMENPAGYGLLYGSPVPGYTAPAEQTTGQGTRVIGLLLVLARDAEQAGVRPTPPAREVHESLHRDAATVGIEFGLEISAPMLVACDLAWVGLFGAVSFELFGQYGPDAFTDRDALFESLLDLLAGVLGLPPPAELEPQI